MKGKEIIVIAATILLVAIVAGLALVSTKAALVVVTGIVTGVIVFFSPFHGLLVYLVLLYIRPQDFMPALEHRRASPAEWAAVGLVVLSCVVVAVLAVTR